MLFGNLEAPLSVSWIAFRCRLHVSPFRGTLWTRAPFEVGEGPEDPQATAQAHTHIGIPERQQGRQQVQRQSQELVARHPLDLARRHGWVQQPTLTHGYPPEHV